MYFLELDQFFPFADSGYRLYHVAKEWKHGRKAV